VSEGRQTGGVLLYVEDLERPKRAKRWARIRASYALSGLRVHIRKRPVSTGSKPLLPFADIHVGDRLLRSRANPPSLCAEFSSPDFFRGESKTKKLCRQIFVSRRIVVCVVGDAALGVPLFLTVSRCLEKFFMPLSGEVKNK
jgi:hypothetical protein